MQGKYSSNSAKVYTYSRDECPEGNEIYKGGTWLKLHDMFLLLYLIGHMYNLDFEPKCNTSDVPAYL